MEQTIQKKWPVGGGSWVTVEVYGEPDAPGLVVVPGAMSDARAWRHVATAIDAWPSVAVVNRRGRTPSGPLTGGYSLRTEVEDLGLILDEFAGTQALFGWSYGGLIALLAANDRSLRQVIAYEPVMRPFGRHVLPELKAAEEKADWEATVEIVNREIAGLDAAHIETLRADRQGWADLQRLSRPAYAEPRRAQRGAATRRDGTSGGPCRPDHRPVQSRNGPLRHVVRRRPAARHPCRGPRTSRSGSPGPPPGADRARPSAQRPRDGPMSDRAVVVASYDRVLSLRS
ncbi:alpha/beta hydrolase [Streptomyces lydicamycinicus]|uniref:alpha/beta fold hydrolase n=1 Tax=Streptomyces lydicamycinicus TaxID=1546107 RepID=UPI002034F0E8|nr:alpha/beta hydrolase [Streptomyces lydicamycinicus]USA00742.1 alpha/beta hydrolase [Streptomyces lydicamycinicus]